MSGHSLLPPLLLAGGRGICPPLAGQGRRSLALPILVFSSKRGRPATEEAVGQQPWSCRRVGHAAPMRTPSTHAHAEHPCARRQTRWAERGLLICPLFSLSLLLLAAPKSDEIILTEVRSPVTPCSPSPPLPAAPWGVHTLRSRLHQAWPLVSGCPVLRHSAPSFLRTIVSLNVLD